MSHEQSDTQDLQERSLAEILRQRFVNLYGPGTKKAGQLLSGGKLYYRLLEEARKAAAERSAAHGRRSVHR